VSGKPQQALAPALAAVANRSGLPACGRQDDRRDNIAAVPTAHSPGGGVDVLKRFAPAGWNCAASVLHVDSPRLVFPRSLTICCSSGTGRLALFRFRTAATRFVDQFADLVPSRTPLQSIASGVNCLTARRLTG